jgi:predicted ATPase/DNA-binding winged helix-turn-helix (wHTH) protein
VDDLAVTNRNVVSFGPFSLDAGRRLLLKNDTPVDLGGRTLDTLIALLERPNEAISKRDLMAKIWPDVIVEEVNLRFHIGALRKALGDGKDGARYISTLAGRGYCFVAAISRSTDLGGARAEAVASFSHANLPSRLTRMVGRDDDTTRLAAQLTGERFVSVVGAGGVGKTTVAIAVGHHLMESFSGAVLFVDLGMLSDPGLVPMATASMLGLSVRSEDATPNLIAYLRDKRILIILDTCEHLIGAVAALASQIFAAAPKVHILATSREALQLDAEHVYRLDPLGCPPDEEGLTAASVQNYPATQLFIERATASGARLELNDADAALVGDICRKLDGVALAIELAARRIESYGLHRTAALLDQRLTLLWAGQRTAVPRQKTLQATLEWSFALLAELERLVLCRLAVFVGHFTLDAALAVVSSSTLDQSDVLAAIDSLVAKSMVVTRPVGAMVRYRLLDTTRAYALEIDVNSAEIAELSARHAAYCRLWLEQHGKEWSRLSTGTERSAHFAALNNVRAALDWCFGSSGDAGVGISLAAAAMPVFLEMCLFPECQRWSERAIGALDESTRGGAEEMHLQTCFGISSMHMQGQSDMARAALDRSLTLAEASGDVVYQVAVLGMITIFHSRGGDFKTALYYAKLSHAAAEASEEAAPAVLAHSILGRSLSFLGDHGSARAELEAAIQQWNSQLTSTYLGLDWKNQAGICLAWTLWAQGHPAQAADRVREAVSDARRRDDPTSLALALALAPVIFLWIGDLGSAEQHADWSISHAEAHSLGPYLAIGRSYRGVLAIRRGDAKNGVEILRSSLAQLHAARFEVYNAEFKLRLAQGLAATGQFSDAMMLVDRTIAMIEANGNLFHMPEALRVKGSILLQMPQPRAEDAEACFTQSLEWSRRQDARSWELRTAVDLAGLLVARGRPREAGPLLQPMLDQLTEGRETADLKAAADLLAMLKREA